MPHLPAIFALALIPIFAVADRWVGSGKDGRTKPMTFAIVAGGVAGFLTLGAPFTLVGALWAAWRSVGFFHNSLAPETEADQLATALRYSLQLGVAALAFQGLWPVLLVALMISAAIGIGLRVYFGQLVAEARAGGHELEGDFNAFVEKATGAAFGAALASYAILTAIG